MQRKAADPSDRETELRHAADLTTVERPQIKSVEVTSAPSSPNAIADDIFNLRGKQSGQNATANAPYDHEQPVQRRADGPAQEEADVHAQAAAGVATPSQEVPFRGKLESAFGLDLGFVKAHVGGAAGESAAAIGAEAYATGDHVVTGADPSLHTVAHETAHVLQQRGGAVQLKGDVGEAGDRYERDADAAADAVVRGAPVPGAPELPASIEAQIKATLEIRVVEDDLRAAAQRLKLLGAQFGALSEANRKILLARLAHPSKDDELAAIFLYRLSTAARQQLLGVLRGEPLPAPAEPHAPAAEAPATAVSADGAIAPAAAPAAAAPDQPVEPILQSSNPDINGRTVKAAGAELHAKAANYGRFPGQMQQNAAWHLKEEKKVLDEHSGIIGRGINLFNDADAPNPDRWKQMIVDWGVVLVQLNAVNGMQPTAGNINLMGELTQKGLAGWEASMATTSRYSDEFIAYLEGFMQAAKSVHAGVELTAEIAMAGAIACAVVLTGPAALAVGAELAGAVGATGAAATAITTTTGIVGAGVTGAAFKGGTQAGGQMLVETGEMVYDVAAKGKSLSEAADGFDWGTVGDKGWSGVKTGFVDGVMAYGGLAIEGVVNKFAGKAFARLLGPYAGRLYAQVLRLASERALSAGVAGGVSGALDAGVRAALDGKSLPEILAAMEKGAKMGGGLGALFGGAFGAYEGRTAARASGAADELAHAGASSADNATAAAADNAVSARPRSAAAPDIERLDTSRFKQVDAGSFGGTLQKNRLVDEVTGQQYLFKPNPDELGTLRAAEAGITPDSIADRAKASETLARQMGLDTPDVRVVEYNGQVGSLQEWRGGSNRYSLQQLKNDFPDVADRVIKSPEYQRLRSDLDAFDHVVNNLDRNPGNLILELDDAGRVTNLTAIDHDLAFAASAERFVDPLKIWANDLPEKYSRSMYEQLRKIKADPDAFRNSMKVHLSDAEIEGALKRTDEVIADIEGKIAAKGEAGTFFDEAPVATRPTAEPAGEMSTTAADLAGSPELFMSRPPMERTMEHALNRQMYIDDVVEYYGINLRGVQAVYDPALGSGTGRLGVTREVEGGRIIRIGPDAFADQPTLANTIAHELSHARDYMRGVHKPHGDMTSMNDGTVYGAGNALEGWIRSIGGK